MRLSIDIKDETELKNEIKAMVEGYIKQMVREETEKTVKAEISRIMEVYIQDKKTGYYGLAKKVEAAIESNLLGQVKFEIDGHPLLKNTNYIKDILSDKVNAVLKSKNFDSMIGLAVENAKTDAIKKLLGDK